MECLRKVEAKSKNRMSRMSVIVEAGALAIVPNVKHHSLTSKDDITFIEEEPPCPVPKMRSPVNTNIQHTLIRSLVLMALFANIGLVMWDGEKCRASYKKSGEEEEEKIEEKVLSYLFKNYYSIGVILYREEDKTAKKIHEQYWQKLGEYGFQVIDDNRFLQKGNLSVDFFKSLLDIFSKWRNSLKPHVRPYSFFDSLKSIETFWKIYVIEKKYSGVTSIDELNFELDDSNCDVAKIIHNYMLEFSKEYPKFSNSKDYVEFERKYNIFRNDHINVKRITKDMYQYDAKQNDLKLNILTLWEKKIGEKK